MIAHGTCERLHNVHFYFVRPFGGCKWKDIHSTIERTSITKWDDMKRTEWDED